MASSVPGTSRVPCVLNCAYKGGASREGDDEMVSVVRIGEGVRFGGIFDMLGRDGVGEDGD